MDLWTPVYLFSFHFKNARKTLEKQALQQLVLVELHVCMSKNPKRSMLITMHKTKLQMDQRPQHKTKYIEPDRRESGDSLELDDTGEDILNRTPLAQSIRSKINTWDFMKLRSFCMAKDTVLQTIA